MDPFGESNYRDYFFPFFVPLRQIQVGFMLDGNFSIQFGDLTILIRENMGKTRNLMIYGCAHVNQGFRLPSNMGIQQ